MAESFLARIEPQKPISKPTGPVVPPSDAYARKALEGEIEKVETAPEGTRNHTLFASTAALCEIVNAGSLEESTVRDAMTNAGRSAGLDDFEIERTIQSAFDKTQGVVRMIPEREKPAPVSSVQVAEKVAENSAEAAGIDDVWGGYPPVDGADWLFKSDPDPVPIWGKGTSVLWSEGESLMITAAAGVGKSTLGGQLLRARLGLATHVLRLPVVPADRPTLYLAADRPKQILRSLRRQFTPEEHEQIRGNLLVRPGPPVSDVADDPSILVRMAMKANAGTVYIDSLKDVAVGLSTDEVGAKYNRARQMLIREGVELVEMHHLKKPAIDASGGINEVYGSTWLTNGTGSVIVLAGQPGDLVVKLLHVRQPLDEVGPVKLRLDPDKGEFDPVWVDLVKLAAEAGSSGITAEEVAKVLYETGRPREAQKANAERKLDREVRKGKLHRMDGRTPAWFAVENRFNDSPQATEMF